ncbi:MAG: hypothetical protein ACRD1B_02310 [Thermoanaerobaculia bacterium]
MTGGTHPRPRLSETALRRLATPRISPNSASARRAATNAVSDIELIKS